MSLLGLPVCGYLFLSLLMIADLTNPADYDKPEFQAAANRAGLRFIICAAIEVALLLAWIVPLYLAWIDRMQSPATQVGQRNK